MYGCVIDLRIAVGNNVASASLKKLSFETVAISSHFDEKIRNMTGLMLFSTCRSVG